MTINRKDLYPTRRSLVSRLKRWDDEDSWRDFFDSYWTLIYSVSRRAGLSDTESQEVVQETVIAVASKMEKGFRYDPQVDSFRGYLLFLTRKAIATQFRKRRRRLDGPELPWSDNTESVPDPAGVDLESVWDREWEQHLLQRAIATVRRRVNPKLYQAFHYYVLKEWPVKEVAKTLDLNSAQIYLAKHRVSKMVQKEISRLRRDTAGRRHFN